MTRERVDEMLKAYRFELGRCGHLAAEIQIKQRQLDAERRDFVETLAAPKPQQITDMPRGTTMSNPTERIGGMLADGYRSPEYRAIEGQIAEMEAELNQRSDVVMHVQAWLSGLPQREKLIIECQVIDGVYWRDVAKRYRQTFEEDVSKDTLKRLRDRAMDMIYKMAE